MISFSDRYMASKVILRFLEDVSLKTANLVAYKVARKLYAACLSLNLAAKLIFDY